MLRAMLVAAGYGTRLAPLTAELPKPAVPVANRPLAAYALGHLHAAGVRDFVVNTHHLGERLQAALQPWVPADARLRYSHEREILGTGGGVRAAWRATRDRPLLVWNAKLLFEPDLQWAQRSAAAMAGAHGPVATMLLRPMPEGAAFGPVDIDAEGRVRAILAPGAVAPGLRRCMFTGVHVLSPRAYADLPRHGCVIRDAYRHWIARGQTVTAAVADATWTDVGLGPTIYGEANLDLLRGRLRCRSVPTEVDARGCAVAPDATVAGSARLERCAVGAGACVDPGVTVRDCVVWPGARVRTDAQREIVLTSGQRVPF